MVRNEPFQTAERSRTLPPFCVLALSDASAAPKVHFVRAVVGSTAIRNRSYLCYQLGQATEPLG